MLISSVQRTENEHQTASFWLTIFWFFGLNVYCVDPAPYNPKYETGQHAIHS